jgi:hypothetical protein
MGVKNQVSRDFLSGITSSRGITKFTISADTFEISAKKKILGGH